MVINNSKVTLELLDEEYEIIADFVRKLDRIKRMKNIINKTDISANIKTFLLEDNDRLNLIGLRLEKNLLEGKALYTLLDKITESFDIREYQISCNNENVHTVQLARAQYADIRDILYNQTPFNKNIYDVNGVRINVSDIRHISERRIA